MRVEVKSRHTRVTPELREYAELKSERLAGIYDRLTDVELILDHEGDQFAIEMLVRDDHSNTFVSREVGSDPFALIDLVKGKVERQIRRHKDQLRRH